MLAISENEICQSLYYLVTSHEAVIPGVNQTAAATECRPKLLFSLMEGVLVLFSFLWFQRTDMAQMQCGVFQTRQFNRHLRIFINRRE